MNMKSSIKPAHLWRVAAEGDNVVFLFCFFFYFCYFCHTEKVLCHCEEKLTLYMERSIRRELCSWSRSFTKRSLCKKKRDKRNCQLFQSWEVVKKKKIKAVSFCYQTAYSKTVVPNLFWGTAHIYHQENTPNKKYM